MTEAQLRGMDLNLLVVLDVLLEERSVSRAASRLSLTQSATSRALSRLREQFDDPLLVRTQSGMLPTWRALALEEGLRRTLRELSSITSKASHFEPASLERTFRIATADYCVAVLIPNLLARVEAEARHVRVEVAAPGDRLDAQLEAGEVDLFIGPKRPSHAGVVWKSLLKDEFVTLVRRDHPGVGRSLSPTQFAALGHIVVAPERSPVQSAIDRELTKLGLTRHVALRVPSFLVPPLVVSQSDLVCTTPKRLAQRFAGALPLRLVKTPLVLGPLSLSMAWHERMHHDAGHQWFREHVRKSAESAPGNGS